MSAHVDRLEGLVRRRRAGERLVFVPPPRFPVDPGLLTRDEQVRAALAARAACRRRLTRAGFLRALVDAIERGPDLPPTVSVGLYQLPTSFPPRPDRDVRAAAVTFFNSPAVREPQPIAVHPHVLIDAGGWWHECTCPIGQNHDSAGRRP